PPGTVNAGSVMLVRLPELSRMPKNGRPPGHVSSVIRSCSEMFTPKNQPAPKAPVGNATSAVNATSPAGPSTFRIRNEFGGVGLSMISEYLQATFKLKMPAGPPLVQLPTVM